MTGARVIIAGRDEQAAKETVDEAKHASKNDKIIFMKLDLASFDSVRDFAKKVLESKCLLLLALCSCLLSYFLQQFMK